MLLTESRTRQQDRRCEISEYIDTLSMRLSHLCQESRRINIWFPLWLAHIVCNRRICAVSYNIVTAWVFCIIALEAHNASH